MLSWCKTKLFKISALVSSLMLMSVSSFADIVSYDAATGAIVWDLSILETNIIATIATAMSIGAVVFVMIVGYGYIKRFLRRS